MDPVSLLAVNFSLIQYLSIFIFERINIFADWGEGNTKGRQFTEIGTNVIKHFFNNLQYKVTTYNDQKEIIIMNKSDSLISNPQYCPGLTEPMLVS